MKTALFCTIFILSLILNFTCDKNNTGLEQENDFAIYLVDENTPTISANVDNLKLINEPILTISDIISYNWDNHQITYSNKVYEQLQSLGKLFNRSFVITVDNERIYWGGFRNPISSLGCANPIILLEIDSKIPESIHIERYYVTEPDATEPDPHVDMRIYNALDNAGKLIRK